MAENERADDAKIRYAAEVLQEACYREAKEAGWHNTFYSDDARKFLFPTRLMLIVSELAEAMEGDRTSGMDDKLPHRRANEVELADAVIRIFDLAGAEGMDLAGAVVEKLRYNRTRADHKPENRTKKGGKRY